MRLVVDLESDVNPPSGWLTDEGGIRHRFVGLMQLLSLVETLRLGGTPEREAGSEP